MSTQILLGFLAALLPLVVICGGVLYRCRGGFIGLGENRTNLARLLWWATPTGVFLLALLHSGRVIDSYSDVKTFCLFCTLVLGYWLGLLVGHSWCQDRLTARGMGAVVFIRQLILVILLFVFAGANYALFGGQINPGFPPAWLLIVSPFMLLGSITEMLGWKVHGEYIKWHPKNSTVKLGYDKFAETGGEWAEVFTGAMIWGTLYIAFLVATLYEALR